MAHRHPPLAKVVSMNSMYVVLLPLLRAAFAAMPESGTAPCRARLDGSRPLIAVIGESSGTELTDSADFRK